MDGSPFENRKILVVGRKPARGRKPWSQVPSGKGSGCGERVVVQVKVGGGVEVAQIPFDLSPREPRWDDSARQREAGTARLRPQWGFPSSSG